MIQYKYALKEKGFTICRENLYKNNNKKLNGKKGKIVSMRNAGKDTSKLDEEVKISSTEFEKKANNYLNGSESSEETPVETVKNIDYLICTAIGITILLALVVIIKINKNKKKKEIL